VALLSFPPSPSPGELYPNVPLPGQNQYEWSAAESTWRLLGPATGVVPGCYGDGFTIPTFCVNAQGGLESVTPVTIASSIPDATTTSKGLVQVGSNIDVVGGIISVGLASGTDFGVVQVGSNIDVVGGVISVGLASGTDFGVVQVGSNIDVVGGIISVGLASGTDFGVVQVGSNVQVSGGVISILNASTTNVGVVQLATGAETITGTNATIAVTPSGLQAKVSDSTSLISSTRIASSLAVKTAYDLADAAVPDLTYTAKGDIVVGTGASTYSALGVGSNGQVLTADSASAEGVSWQTSPASVYRYVQFDDISAQFDDVASTFNLTVGSVATSPTPSTNIMVFLGGVVQIPGDAYTIAGSQITFLGPPPAGSSFYATTVSP